MPNKEQVHLNLKNKKIAIVHDWLYGGGAEKVVQELHNLFPDAPIYTSMATPEWQDKLDNKVISGYLNKWPFNKIRKFIPFLRILWFERLDLTEYDLIISSSGAEAKGIKKLKPGAIHINYCHAPTHYYWSRYDEYMNEPGFGSLNFLARLGLAALITPLKQWDYNAAQRPEYIIANSTNIQKQIKNYYDRDSVVIHPPVNIKKTHLKSPRRKGLIIVGRQVPYKKIDLAIKAAIRLNLLLKVVGNGPMRQKLANIAENKRNIKFLTNVTDKQMPKLLAQAEIFLFPGVEDFGIAPVEALAAGTPVIAYKEGGVLDYLNKSNAILFEEQTVEELASAIQKGLAVKWNYKQIAKSAQKFSKDNFQKNIKSFLKTLV